MSRSNNNLSDAVENLDIAHTWTENLDIAHTWTENLETELIHRDATKAIAA